MATKKARQAVAKRDSDAVTVFNAPTGYKVARQLVLPRMLLQINEPKILVITGKLAVSMQSTDNPNQERQRPMTIVPVGDTETGKQYQLIVPAVVESSFRELYPDDEYIGKTFYMNKLAKREGRRYHDVELYELERDAQ